MASTVLPSESLFQESLRQGQVRHAIKVALACCLATATAYYFHLRSEQLAPRLRLPAVHARHAQSADELAAHADRGHHRRHRLGDHPRLLPRSVVSLPGTHAAVDLHLPAVQRLVAVSRDDGRHDLRDRRLHISRRQRRCNARFLRRLRGQLPDRRPVRRRGPHFHLAAQHAESLRRGGWPRPMPTSNKNAARAANGSAPASRRRRSQPFEDWAPFRPLRQLLAPELFRGRDTTNPFAGLILACRSLNLRLWFFNRAFGHVPPDATLDRNASPTRRSPRRLCRPAWLASSPARSNRKPVAAVDPELARRRGACRLPTPRQADPLIAHNVHASILRMCWRRSANRHASSTTSYSPTSAAASTASSSLSGPVPTRPDSSTSNRFAPA